MISFEIDRAEYRDEIRRAVDQGLLDQRQAMANVMEQVGREVIAFLRSTTAHRVPPVRKGQPWRRAHPGGWADVTANLSGSLDFRVEPLQDGMQLVFLAGMEYAAILEAREGIFVLRGITDPGGPVEKALRKAIDDITPGWQLELGL